MERTLSRRAVSRIMPRKLHVVATFVALTVLASCGGDDGSTASEMTDESTPTTAITTTTIAVTTTTESLAEPSRVLFIGDDITYWDGGVDAALRRLASSTDPPQMIETDSVVRWVASLKTLWSTDTRDVIATGGYDVVVLQDDLGLATNDVETFQEYVRKFDTEIRAAGARTVLFMHYAYEDYGVVRHSLEEIAQAHWDMAAELSVDVAPVGLAWQQAAMEQPELDLNETNGATPSFQGTYLAANVIYATIFGESLESPTYLMPEMTEEQGIILRDIAWRAVREHLAS